MTDSVGNSMEAGREQENHRRDLEIAHSHFRAGDFAGAEKTYLKIRNEDPKDHRAAARLGYIALLANRLEDAQKWLTEAIKLKPEEAALKIFARRGLLSPGQIPASSPVVARQ